jgi:hypothetical protein
MTRRYVGVRPPGRASSTGASPPEGLLTSLYGFPRLPERFRLRPIIARGL